MREVAGTTEPRRALRARDVLLVAKGQGRMDIPGWGPNHAPCRGGDQLWARPFRWTCTGMPRADPGVALKSAWRLDRVVALAALLINLPQ